MKNPSLRFKGDFLPWEIATLSDCLQERGERNLANSFSRDDVLSVTAESGVVNQIEYLGRSFAGVDLSCYKIVDCSNIVYTKSPLKEFPFGIVKCNKGRAGIVSTLYSVFSVKKHVDPVFVDYYFSRPVVVNNYLRPLVNIGAKNDMKISNATFLSGSVTFPCSIEEQQKIAAFFTALDEKIRLAQQKLTLVLKIKNGVTKKIFLQEIRFKNTDGSFFKPWKSYTVGELAEVIGGGTPSTQNSDYWNGDIYWLTPAEINSKYVHSSNRKITVSGLNNSSAKLLPKGALLLTTRATLGACSINNQDNHVCTNQGFQSLVCNDFVDNEFMYYVVTANEFQKAMVQRASGSTFLEISSKNLKAITVNLPSLDEQRQIATLLSFLDEKIEYLKQRVDVLKTQKASLMQQMFI